jgi:hypothetical protein
VGHQSEVAIQVEFENQARTMTYCPHCHNEQNLTFPVGQIFVCGLCGLVQRTGVGRSETITQEEWESLDEAVKHNVEHLTILVTMQLNQTFRSNSFT